MERITNALQTELTARETSSERCGELLSVVDYDPRQETEILRMVGKLLALFPRRDSAEFTLEAYCDELRHIPWRWVGLAMRDLTSEDGRVFCPSISEVKTAIARRIRHYRSQRNGGTPESYSPITGNVLAANAELDWLRRRVDSDLRAGKLPPGVTSQQIAAQAAEWMTS